MKGFWKSGDLFVWWTGAALAFALLVVAGLIGLVAWSGLGFFWPRDVELLTLDDGKAVLGEVLEREEIPQFDAPPGTPIRHRLKIKQGNRDLYAADYIWVDEARIVRRETPPKTVVLERLEWGNFYGTIREVREEGKIVASGPKAGWTALTAALPGSLARAEEIRGIEKGDVGDINYDQERIRLALRRLELDGISEGPEVERLKAERSRLQERYAGLEDRIRDLRKLHGRIEVVFGAAGSREKTVPLSQIVRAYRPNTMGTGGKTAFYAAKLWEFVSGDPRESNTEGGVFPAIFGTVMMVLIMSVIVTPLGVLAAFYLREYARQGTLVSAVRIAVNNLAGVPSIVYGVFGVAFFIYFVGGGIDRMFYPERLPTPTFGTGGILWASLTLALMTVPIVIVWTEEGLAAIPPNQREASLALGRRGGRRPGGWSSPR